MKYQKALGDPATKSGKKEKDKSNLSSKESENIKTKSKFEVISDSSSNDEWESF